MAPVSFTLPYWYDLHAHFRQGGLLRPLLQAHAAMGCAGILAMPNTKPPVAKVLRKDPAEGWSIEEYLGMIRGNGGEVFDAVIVPLYLTAATTPGMIAEGAKSGLLRAAKYYPPHGTTGAEFGRPLAHYMQNGVFRAMEEHGVILCLHGEEHALPGERYFDRATNAEEFFYRERFPRLLESYPALKIVAEHLTTKTGAEAVRAGGQNIAASITPQHLLYTVGHLLQGLKHHLYCLPLLKFEEDRAALRAAVLNPGNTQFFAGTDSAPHTKKATACGCAAGCFTGGIAPQLYAEAFEAAGADLSQHLAQKSFIRFLCEIGAGFYGLPLPVKTMTLTKTPQTVSPLATPDGPVTPLALGMSANCAEGAAAISWSLAI